MEYCVGDDVVENVECSHHRLQQPRQIQTRGLADFDDFGMMQRLWSQTGGPVGEDGDAGDFHAERAGLNRLG